MTLIMCDYISLNDLFTNLTAQIIQRNNHQRNRNHHHTGLPIFQQVDILHQNKANTIIADKTHLNFTVGSTAFVNVLKVFSMKSRTWGETWIASWQDR